MKCRYFFIPVVLIMLLCTGCPPSGPVPQWDKIRDYHLLFRGMEQPQSSSRNVDFYLDFTRGLQVAFRDDNTKNFFESVIRSMKIGAIDFYELAKDSISMIENMATDELFLRLRNMQNYDQAFAPIDKALNKIISNNCFSILVTDGEMWKRGSGEEASNEPWARSSFATWLNKGNRIDFYVTDHPDAGRTKHLFYMIFVPAEMKEEKLPSDDISFFLNNDVQGKTLHYTKFSFSNCFYSFRQDYQTAKTPGAVEEMATDPGTYINDPVLGFEYLDFALDWKNIVKYIRNARDESTGNPIEGGKPFLRKLFLNAKNSELYKIGGIKLKVYDIYDDYLQYEFCKQCEADPPVFQKDDKGNIELDLNNNNLPIILEEGLPDCYDEKGNLLPERKYNGPKIKAVEDILALDDNLFRYGYDRDTVGEVGIKIHPNFNGTQLSADHENLLRVDIVLSDCIPNTSNPKFDKFKWQGRQISENRGLYESIILAINDANPSGKVIYSYYLKTLPNNFQE